MSHYLADLVIVFKTAGWMLATFAVPLALGALCAAAIKSVSPDRITSRAQERS